MKSPRLLTIVAIITSLLAIALFFYNVKLSRTIDKKDTLLLSSSLSLQKSDSVVNRQRQIIHTQTVVITSSQSSINDLTNKVFSLTKKDEKNTQTIAYFQNRSTTSIKKIYIPYLDSAVLQDLEDSSTASIATLKQYIEDSTIKVGTRAEEHTPNYHFSATIQQEGLEINNLSIPDTLSLRFVEKKYPFPQSLFKKPFTQVQYFHSNPLVTNNSSNSVFFVPKRKSFFSRVILPVAGGIVTGYLITR